MDPLTLATTGAGLLELLISEFTKSSAPQQVIDALVAASTAVVSHKDDLITKANLEAQRG